MPHIRTQIEIMAPASTVWRILTDLPAQPDWNPAMFAMHGTAIAGNRLEISFRKEAGDKGMTVKPVVEVAELYQRFVWRGTFWSSALFAGRHQFHLEELPGWGTRLHHGEDFTGLLAGLIMNRKGLASTERMFRRMNEALKAHAENADQSTGSDAVAEASR